MKKVLLAKKIGMTQIFGNLSGDQKNARVYSVTVLEAGPCVVTNIKTKEKDGYTAVQLGFGKKTRVSKPVFGQVKRLGNFALIKEFRLDNEADVKVGDKISADSFEVGEKVNATALNKGRGFQGVVKRHGFKTAHTTHGQKDRVRAPGSIGAMSPPRVLKGTKLPGHMGQERTTIRNMRVVQVDAVKNLLYVWGAIPGNKGTVVEIREAALTNSGRVRRAQKIHA
ncbi:MAG: 50S ribosomal protein L3 [Parcubacteria group bacterium GW2011_GWC1_41_7]|nr:MAG: 50S ribosomal protein L3 [Parcubacteria group bacterium GW2011_GWC1_41_7]